MWNFNRKSLKVLRKEHKKCIEFAIWNFNRKERKTYKLFTIRLIPFLIKETLKFISNPSLQSVNFK